jgi:hypothetical protein
MNHQCTLRRISPYVWGAYRTEVVAPNAAFGFVAQRIDRTAAIIPVPDLLDRDGPTPFYSLLLPSVPAALAALAAHGDAVWATQGRATGDLRDALGGLFRAERSDSGRDAA